VLRPGDDVLIYDRWREWRETGLEPIVVCDFFKSAMSESTTVSSTSRWRRCIDAGMEAAAFDPDQLDAGRVASRLLEDGRRSQIQKLFDAARIASETWQDSRRFC